LTLDVACNTGRNMVATCGGRGKKDDRCWMLHVTSFEHARNMFATRLQHRSLNVARTTVRNIAKVVRNICYASQRDRRLIGSLHPNRATQDPYDASARIGHPGASSSVIGFLLFDHQTDESEIASELLVPARPNRAHGECAGPTQRGGQG
jgi:hypothetical protein